MMQGRFPISYEEMRAIEDEADYEFNARADYWSEIAAEHMDNTIEGVGCEDLFVGPPTPFELRDDEIPF